MTQARRGMKLKRTHPRVGRKRKAASPWDRGDLPFRLMFALVALCFLLRVFLSDTERKRVKIGARWSIFWTRISGGDSKINKKKIQADRNEPRRVFSSRFFGDRSKGELTNFEAIREFVGTKKREFFLRTMARLASNLNIKGDRRTTS